MIIQSQEHGDPFSGKGDWGARSHSQTSPEDSLMAWLWVFFSLQWSKQEILVEFGRLGDITDVAKSGSVNHLSLRLLYNHLPLVCPKSYNAYKLSTWMSLMCKIAFFYIYSFASGRTLVLVMPFWPLTNLIEKAWDW